MTIASRILEKMSKWVIMNASPVTGKLANLADGLKLLGNDDGTVVVAGKDGGKAAQSIFISGSGSPEEYGYKVGDLVPYVTDTGNGYGKKGELYVDNLLTIKGGKVVKSVKAVDNVEKRAWYVFK